MKLSINQYAKQVGVSPQAVRYRLLNNITLPGVEKVELIAGRTVLTCVSGNLQQVCKNKYRKNVC